MNFEEEVEYFLEQEEFDPTKNIWRCPCCQAINTWNWQDAKEIKKLLKKKEIFVATGSCYDNICGSCKTNFVEKDSPINHSCYTHEE